MKKIMIVIGTRPEAVKLAPLVRTLRTKSTAFTVQIMLSGQHGELVDEVLEIFELRPDYLLPAPPRSRTLAELHAHLLREIANAFTTAKPDLVLVQGDTTTALAAAQAAFYQQIMVGHVEAGLHTDRLDEPFPEEANRRQISRLANFHFAPTVGAANYLQQTGIAANCILLTGNTGVDALHWMLAINHHIPPPIEHWIPNFNPAYDFGLVTFHRRENQGERLELFCEQLRRLVGEKDLYYYFPLHPNPTLRQAITRRLGDLSRVILLPALPYAIFIELMQRAVLLISDSGGIQEEASALGKPILLLRDTTERPEGIECGNTIPVTLTDDTLLREVKRLREDPIYYQEKSGRESPFGDGHASERIANFLLKTSERGVWP